MDQMSDRMAGMDMNGGPMPRHNSAGRGPRPGPGGFPDQRRGAPQDQSYGYPDDRYVTPVSPTRNDFGPPARSMTMPHEAPPRMDSGAYPPPGRNMPPPPRPSTAGGHRPPPHRTYPDQSPPPPMPQNNAMLEPGWGNEPARASFGDFYDSYYDQPGGGEAYPPPGGRRDDIPDFDAAPPQASRNSFEQSMAPGPGTPQPGPARFPEVSKVRSQPNLREPQVAVFEMASDMPPVPAGGFQPYNGFNGGPPPGPMPSNPAPMRYGTPGPSMGHPAPIRPGLMQNSIVNVHDKPAPVRNYNGGTPPGASGAQGRPAPPPQNARPTSGTVPPVTIEELEQLRATIKYEPNDQQSALILAKKLVEAADVLVTTLPDPKTRARARERYLTDAHKILKKLSHAQNPDAMFFFADCLGRGGLGFDADNKEAFTQYQSAAKLGHAAAAYRTAVCCELGNDDGGGTRKDPLKAMQWYKRAATLGDTPAMYKVGMIMLKGLLGQPRNPREAVGWLKRAAERADSENPHALHELGLLYESAQPNDVILRDEAYAFQLFEQAAQLGYKFSQFRMGCAYEYGLMGSSIDPRQSIMWYSRAAAQGEHQSELALSGWYLTGSEGVLGQSDAEAYLWARKAAVAGLAKAEYAMGYFTEVGIGIQPNLEDAKRWY
jgi:TPR repeat protein